MKYSNSQRIEYEYPSQPVSWVTRDVLLFNHSIGATADELHLLYEQDARFQAPPTFASILPYKGTSQDIVDFNTLQKPSDIQVLVGVPAFDRKRVLDGHKQMICHKALPVSSEGRRFELRQRLVSLRDRGDRGTIIETSTDLLDKDSQEVHVTFVGTVHAIGQGNWDGPNGPSIHLPTVPSDRRPDFFHTQHTNNETALLYRLNGDYNPLHFLPGAGDKMGFQKPILHGLYTWNMAAHALLQTTAPGGTATLKEFQARFAAPVFPGQTLRTHIWRVAARSAGHEPADKTYVFQVVNEQDKVVLGNGSAVVQPTPTPTPKSAKSARL